MLFAWRPQPELLVANYANTAPASWREVALILTFSFESTLFSAG